MREGGEQGGRYVSEIFAIMCWSANSVNEKLMHGEGKMVDG